MINEEKFETHDKETSQFCKKHVDSDVELGLENRGLTTDMLGLPTITKTSPEILISSLNTSEMSKISIKEELLEKHLMQSKNSNINPNQALLDALDEISKLW